MASGQTRGHEGFVVVGKIRPQVRRPDGPRRYPDIECRSTLNAQLQTVTGKLLTQVLGQSEHIHALIEQSVEELSSANTGIKHELAHCDPLPGVKSALEKNDAITRKLHDASERLAAVNEALRIGIRDRAMVDHQLAAAVEQEEGSRSAALHDALTGLPNRVLFKDRLEHGIAQAKRHRWILAVMFVDLDNFKSINDTYGHSVGDECLKAAAQAMVKGMLRGTDRVARWGGEEFIVLLPNAARDAAHAIAQRVLKAVGDTLIPHPEGMVRLACSIGVATLTPKDRREPKHLINDADRALYRAKTQGRNRVVASAA